MSTGYSREAKAGTCDAAWYAPCTWAPLWWLCLLGALYQVLFAHMALALRAQRAIE